MTTVPNDSRYGPWAGKIITGDEFTHTIYAIDTSGTVTTNEFNISPADFDLVVPNQDLYFTDDYAGLVLRIPNQLLTNALSDVVITEAGERSIPYDGHLYFVHWDQSVTNFVVKTIYPPHVGPYTKAFEHSAFAPISLPAITPP